VIRWERESRMAGIVVFKDVDTALKNGWSIVEESADGYIVQKKCERPDGRLEAGLGRVVLKDQKIADSPKKPGFRL
jgi:hypothetical protein